MEEEDDLFTYHVSEKAMRFSSEEEEEECPSDENNTSDRLSNGRRRARTSQVGADRQTDVEVSVKRTRSCRTSPEGSVKLLSSVEDRIAESFVDDVGDAFVREFLDASPPVVNNKVVELQGLTPEYARLRAAITKKELALRDLSDQEEENCTSPSHKSCCLMPADTGKTANHRIDVNCLYPSAADRFNVRLCDPVGKLLKAVQQVGQRNGWLKEGDSHQLTKHGIPLDPEKSLQEEGLTMDDIIEVKTKAVEGNTVRLACQCPHGKATFVMQTNDKLASLFESFFEKAVENNWCRRSSVLKFCWDGEVLSGQTKVGAIDADNDDIIEVFIT